MEEFNEIVFQLATAITKALSATRRLENASAPRRASRETTATSVTPQITILETQPMDRAFVGHFILYRPH